MPRSATSSVFQPTRSRLAGAAVTAGAVLAFAAPASADNGVTVYPAAGSNPAFAGALEARGYNQLATESFERNASRMDDPLDSSGNTVYLAGEIPEGLTFQSNRSPRGEAGPDPVGDDALAVNATVDHHGNRGPNQLRTPVGGSSLDILVEGERYRAMQVGVPVASWIRVFDAEGRLLDTEFVNDPYQGIVADSGVELGRINVTTETPGNHHGIHGDEHLQEVVAYGEGEGEPVEPQEPTPGPAPEEAGGYSGGLLGSVLGRIGEVVGVKRDMRAGTATVAVKMTGPARVSLASNKRVRGVVKRVSRAGTVKLKVRLRDGARRRLARAAGDSRASLPVRVRITCRAGERSYTTTKTIRLVRRG